MSLFGDVTTETEPLNGDGDTSPKSVPFTQLDDVPMPDSKKAGRPSRIKVEVQNLYMAAGLGVYPFDNAIGSLLADNAENCAVAWDELAKKNPSIKRTLEKLLETSAYGTLIAAHMPIAVAVATKYVPHLRDTYEQVFAQTQQTE